MNGNYAPLPEGMKMSELIEELRAAQASLAYHVSRRAWAVARYDGNPSNPDDRIREAEHRVLAITRILQRRRRFPR